MKNIISSSLLFKIPLFASCSLFFVAYYFSNFGTQGALIFTILVNLFLFFSVFRSVDYKTFVKLIVICLICLIGTITHLEYFFNWYQIFRSQLWTILTPIFLIGTLNVSSRFDSKRINNFINTFALLSIFICLAELIDLSFGSEITPVYIRSTQLDSSDRIYPIGYEMIYALLPVFYVYKKWLSLIASLLIITITGGKTGFALSLVAFFFIFFQFESNSVKRIFMIIIGSLFAYFWFQSLEVRITNFSNEGDIRRYDQILDGLTLLLERPFSLISGIGLGTQFSGGYEDFSTNIFADNMQLIDNSKYDIENGYMYIFMRFGFIGSLIYLSLIIKRLGALNFYFLTYLAITWLGSSPVGPSTALSFAFFAFSSIALSRYQGK